MSETVFILGAGASKQAGAPVMEDFLDVAYDLMKRKENWEIARDSELVFKGIDELQRTHSKAILDLRNLESVFAAFEMGLLLRRIEGLTVEEVEKLPSAMRHVICHTLESTVHFRVVQSPRIHIAPPPPYQQFANMLRKYKDQGHSVSILTFNYDVCADYALTAASLFPEYCLGLFKPTQSSDSVKLFKLHGSLNWAYCAKCKDIVPWPIADYIRNQHLPLAEESIRLRISTHLSGLAHDRCGQPCGGEPVIVPPTWNKTEYHQQVEKVWISAAQELSDTENIFVCGYSLPGTDKFFHYLYALGSVGQARLKRFWVFNPDKEVEARFRSILGQTALQRFQFNPITFEASLGTIGSVLARD